MTKVLYVSGSRADYGPMRRILLDIKSTPDLSLDILVTGMHLDPMHGETWQEIAADGFNIAERVYGRANGDSLRVMAASLGLYLYGMCEAIEIIKPDIVMVTGDRGEQLAGAMAAAFQNVVVVHIAGGSISGSIDDSVRHAITKFAHYHLPASEKQAGRIIQMGENPARVRTVGLPGSDINPDVIYTRSEICAQLGLDNTQPYLLLVQHPVTHSQGEAARQVIETLEALVSSNYPALLANPNDDAGGRAILNTMKIYAERYSHLHILPPQNSRTRFASIMAHCAALLGNSSSGIVEAMSVHLPVINIGDRQYGREHLACLLNVDYDRKQIQAAINTALFDANYRQKLNSFASPLIRTDTSTQIIDLLRNLDLSAASRPKRFYTFQPDDIPGPIVKGAI